MNAEERMAMMLKAGKPALAKIDAILLGRDDDVSAPHHEVRSFATYGVTQAAKMLNVSRKTVYAMIHANVLPAIFNGRTKRITHEAMTAYIMNGGTP